MSRPAPLGFHPEPTASAPINRGQAEIVPLSAIIVRPEFNARTTYREIESLAASIEENGLEQPLVVYFLEDPDDPDGVPSRFFLQSGFRRHQALTLIAERRHDPDLEVAVQIKSFLSHDEAMFSALAVDATGDPLRNFDLAVRLDYLQRKYPKKDLPRITGLGAVIVKDLLSCLRDLDPKVIDAWSRAPSPDMEIPLTRLRAWRREGPVDQRRLLAAYQDGDRPILEEDGEPARGRRGRLDGRSSRPTPSSLRYELAAIETRLEEGATPEDAARLSGIAKGLKFALGQVKRLP